MFLRLSKEKFHNTNFGFIRKTLTKNSYDKSFIDPLTRIINREYNSKNNNLKYMSLPYKRGYQNILNKFF